MRKEENKMDRLTKFEVMLNEIMTTAAKEKTTNGCAQICRQRKKRNLSTTDGQPFNVYANNRTI